MNRGGGGIGFSVDGKSVGTALPSRDASSSSGTVPDPSTIYELNELKRKLEIKEGDVKRKYRDIQNLQLEVTRHQKEIKALNEEVQTVRDRNELLQASLTTARATIAGQTAQLEEAAESNRSLLRVKEVEAALADATKTVARLENDVAQLRAKSADGLQKGHASELERLRRQLEAAEKAEEAAKNDAFDSQLKVDRLTSDNAAYAKEIDTLRKNLSAARNQALCSADATGERDKALQAKERALEAALTETERLKSSLKVRNETNASLRADIEELRLAALASEGVAQDRARLEGLEKENASLRQELGVAAADADGKGSTLQRLEADRAKLKKQLEAVTATMSAHALEIQQQHAAAAAYKTELKALGKEVARLRGENRDMRGHADELRELPLLKERELLTTKQAVAAALRERHAAEEATAAERRQRQAAEEISRSLKQRVAYLMDQMEQVGEVRAAWVQQKAVLKAQVGALHAANVALRGRRLEGGVGAGVGREDATEGAPGYKRRSYGRQDHEEEEEEDEDDDEDAYKQDQDDDEECDDEENRQTDVERAFLTEIAAADNGGKRKKGKRGPRGRDEGAEETKGGRRRPCGDAAGVAMGTRDTANVADGDVQTAAERAIERAMFDTVCAFTSGTAGATHVGAAAANKTDAFSFRAAQGDDGTWELYYSDRDRDRARREGEWGGLGGPAGKDARDRLAQKTIGDELLAALQLPAFLQFCQHQSADRVAALLVSKVALVLNFHVHAVSEAHALLREARMETAALLARAGYAGDRVRAAKQAYTRERLAKQAFLLKYVKEAMRLSDARVVLDDVHRRAREHLQASGGLGGARAGAGAGAGLGHVSGLEAAVAEDRDRARVRALCRQVVTVADELATVAVPSGSGTGPPGALELKLSDSAVDDEAVHCLVGALRERPAAAVDLEEKKAQSKGAAGRVQRPEVDSDDEDGASAEGGGGRPRPTAASFAALALSGGPYVNRILLLNLKGNQLTDVACRALAAVVEGSANLRMLDLRNNAITAAGAKTLMGAVSRNATVVHTTQKKAPTSTPVASKSARAGADAAAPPLMLMIEGARELAGVASLGLDYIKGGKAGPDEAPRHPLRIDLRHNEAARAAEVVEEALENTFFQTGDQAAEAAAAAAGAMAVPGNAGKRPKAATMRPHSAVAAAATAAGGRKASGRRVKSARYGRRVRRGRRGSDADANAVGDGDGVYDDEGEDEDGDGDGDGDEGIGKDVLDLVDGRVRRPTLRQRPAPARDPSSAHVDSLLRGFDATMGLGAAAYASSAGPMGPAGAGAGAGAVASRPLSANAAFKIRKQQKADAQPLPDRLGGTAAAAGGSGRYILSARMQEVQSAYTTRDPRYDELLQQITANLNELQKHRAATNAMYAPPAASAGSENRISAKEVQHAIAAPHRAADGARGPAVSPLRLIAAMAARSKHAAGNGDKSARPPSAGHRRSAASAAARAPPVPPVPPVPSGAAAAAPVSSSSRPRSANAALKASRGGASGQGGYNHLLRASHGKATPTAALGSPWRDDFDIGYPGDGGFGFGFGAAAGTGTGTGTGAVGGTRNAVPRPQSGSSVGRRDRDRARRATADTVPTATAAASQPHALPSPAAAHSGTGLSAAAAEMEAILKGMRQAASTPATLF